ncbi:MAG: hypothetical protein PHZ05_03690, partial [Pygmaiobacter massiliensis]|nr:hypothetical protein [Pygmaiobacter massiliensis]
QLVISSHVILFSLQQCACLPVRFFARQRFLKAARPLLFTCAHGQSFSSGFSIIESRFCVKPLSFICNLLHSKIDPFTG